MQPLVPARTTLTSAPAVDLGPALSPAAAVIPAPVHAPPGPGASPTPVAALPADFAGKLGGLGLSSAQVDAVLSLSREVVEQVVWEVVPALAETIIKEELKRLLQA